MFLIISEYIGSFWIGWNLFQYVINITWFVKSVMSRYKRGSGDSEVQINNKPTRIPFSQDTCWLQLFSFVPFQSLSLSLGLNLSLSLISVSLSHSISLVLPLLFSPSLDYFPPRFLFSMCFGCPVLSPFLFSGLLLR